MSRILRFFVCLGTLFFAGNALAAGYTCSSLPKYLSCQHGYYMTSSQSSTTYNGTPKVGNYCQPCSRMGSNYTCAGGTAAPVQSAGGYTCPTYKKYTSCSAGYYMTDSSTSKTYNGSPKAGNACRPCSVYGSNYTCDGGTAAPRAITVNVTCQAGQYLPKGATSCTTCPAGSYCPGQTCSGVSLVSGATSACGLTTCPGGYSNSAAGSSNINDCYLTLRDGEMVDVVNMGSQLCNEGYYCNHDGQKIYYDSNNEERGLTDSRPTVGGYEACARGSYAADYEATACDPCTNGKTTSGTGSTSCDVTCSNSENVATWVTPEWTPNYVSNSCKVASCVACTKGTGVASCTASTDRNACIYTATCASGYKNPTCNGSSCSCEVGSYTITLNATANGGTGGMSAVYEVPSVGWYSNAALTTSISSVTMPTKANSVFNGYYSAQSGGTRYITNAGALPSNTTFSANTTLYAQYSAASCNVTNGSATMSISGNKVSCAVTCKTGYSQSGGTNATTSFTVTGAVGTASVSASCSPRTFTVSLMSYDGASTHSTIYEKYATGWYSNSAATTTLSKATVPTRSGYKFRGFYTAKQSDVSANGGSGTRRIAADGTLPSNTTFTANTSLYAAWAKDCTTPAHGSCTATIGSDGSVSYTTSCNTGYTLSGANTANPTCTPNSYTCSAGQYLKAGATACTTCTANSWCGGGTFSFNSETDQGLNACPSDYSYSDAGTSSENNCYKNATNTGSQIAPALPTGCAAQTVTACHPDKCWYRIYKSGTTTSCTPTNCNQTHKACTSASKNYYLASGVAKSCSSADASYPSSDGGDIAASSCYGTFSKTGSQVNGSVPTGCASVTSWNACTPGTCQYTKYASGTVKTDCTPTNCTKTVKSVTASAKYYANGTSCSACPSGYPNSDAGNSGGITACYSNSKSRAWTGSQVNGSTPTNCNSVTSWNACSLPACSYVAYSNSTGNGDGTIKSGCSTNSANCTKTVKSVTASAKYYANGASCSACPSGYPNSDAGNSGGITACYSNSKSRAWTGSQVNGSTPTNCNSVTSWNACSLPACSYVAYSNSTGNGDGTIKSGCSTNNASCTKTVAAVTAKSGYYVSGTSCTQCKELASGMYPNSDNGNTGGASACRTNSLSGQVIATANASSTTQCVAGTFKAAHTVNYGGTSSSCGVCSNNQYSDAGAASCTGCKTANGYTNSGTTAASHAGEASCKTTCSGTQYVATAGAGCVTVDTGHYGRTAASTTVAQNATLARTKCPSIYVNGAAATQESECAVQTTAGKYIAAAKATEQTKCPAKNYCPSESVKYGETNSPTACPTADATTARTTYPDDYLNPTRLSISNQGWSTGLPAITSCSANYTFTNAAGNFTVESVSYNSTTGKYEVGGGKYYTFVNAGWYLVDKYSETYCNEPTNRMLYHNVAECPANSYCPGYKSIPLCSTGTHNDEMGKYPCRGLGNGYDYSPAKSGEDTACYLTTTAGKFVKIAKSAEVTCESPYYCPGGVKVNYGSVGGNSNCSDLTGVSVSGGTYTSAAGSSANTACKYTAPSKTITGCKTVTTNTVTYSGTAWPATTYGVTANGGYIISGNNTAAATCSQCSGAVWSAGGTATSCSACPAQTSGWTRNSGTGWTAVTQCNQTQNVGGNCSAGVLKQNATSTTAWGTTTISTPLQAKPGSIVNGQKCDACNPGTYSAGGTATSCNACANWTYAASTGMSSCTACPVLTSGWTKADSTGTGWKSHTSCVQISPKPANCAGGNLKQVAASNGATTWGASTVNSALSSNPGYYINDTACSPCTGATYYGGGTATSCTPCPGIYTSNTTAAKSKAEQCTVQTTGGYYIKAAKDSTQTECDGGYYCPSTTVAYGSYNTQTACPVPADHKRATIPAEYYTNSIANTYIAMSGRKSAITECQALNTYEGTRGSLYDYVTYNTTTQKYDVQGSVLWFKANPGYYLTTTTGCGTYAYYGVAKECDKNAYCPGKDKVECNSSNQATVQVEKFGLELCSALGNGKYATSDGGAAAKSTAACYLTTSNSKFVSAAGAAEGTCTAGGWCPGGVRVNYGSTGGRNTCPTKYPSSAASSNSELDCYVTTAAGKYVATVGAGQVNCAGTGYYCPGGTNVYSGAYGSRLTTGGRTQCPAGYRDLVATASTTKEAQCTMNVAGGKYVATAKESVASGTCAAGYAKAAHSVTYGNTSSCAACTGTTYAENTGQASCTACPTQSGVTNISYWISTGTHTDANGCYGFYNNVALDNGSAARIQCFWDKTKSQYDTSCGAMKDGLKCNAAYYNAALESSPTNNAAYYTDKASVIAKACTSVGKGYWSPADVYTRTQCPAGYRDGAAGVSEAQCTMNVAGGKYVAKANESAASGTCAAGYAKAAHSVTYGNTSSCAACTGATYAASTGQASCTACPTAKTYASAVKSYGYWNNGKDGDHTISDGCYATMTGTLSNGSLTEHGCYLGTDGDYGNGGGKRCYVHQDNLKCNAGYYASTLSNGYVWNNTRAGLLGNTCVGVGAGYYSAANILTRNQCPTGLTTIGYGAGADEVTDCGRILHFGNDKLYLRSGKKTTPSLNVKIDDTTYYGNMTAGTGKGKLRLKSGSTTYSVHDDSM